MRSLLPGVRSADLQAAAYSVAPPSPVPLQLASPWAPRGELAAVLMADIFGTDVPLPLTRAQAMAIPSAARARHVLVGMIASTPLRTYGRTGSPIAPAPWINRTDGPLSPWHRMAWTVDDLIWYGWSCWERTNGADGWPLTMNRLAPGSWSVETDTGRILRDRGDGIHEPVRLDSVVLIPGPHEGLLVFAQDTLRHARDLQVAAGQASRTPAAHLVLQQTGGSPLPLTLPDSNTTDMSVDRLIAQWKAARLGSNAGVAYLPQSIEAHELGTFSEHLLTEGRNAAAVDVARMAGLPADLIDASPGQGSLTYTNSRDNDRRAIDYGASLYMGAVQAALSQDPVCPQGQTQAFDLQQWLEANVPGQDPAATPAPAPAPAPAAPATQEVPAV